MRDFIIKFIADYLVIVIVVGGAALILLSVKKDRYQVYARIGMMGLTSLLLAKIASLVIQPDIERPFQLLGQAPLAAYLDNPGFPSDHVLFVTAIAIAVTVATRSACWAVIFFGLAIVVAVGRVLALVHSPIDVIGGFLIALLAGGLWYLRSGKTRNKVA